MDVRFFKMIKDKEAFKNLFKVLPAVAAPVAIGTAQQKNGGWLSKYENGGVIEDDRGQWAILVVQSRLARHSSGCGERGARRKDLGDGRLGGRRRVVGLGHHL